MVVDHVASSFSGGVFSHDIQLVDLFIFDVPSGYGRNTTFGIIDDCATSYATLGDCETTSVVSSIIGVGDIISIPNS